MLQKYVLLAICIISLFLSIGCQANQIDNVQSTNYFSNADKQKQLALRKGRGEYEYIVYCLAEASNIKNEPETIPNDFWQDPKLTKRLGTGDCEDQALYLHSLLYLGGVKSEIKFGFVNLRLGTQMHAWVEVENNNVLYVLDSTINNFILQRRHIPEYTYLYCDGHQNIRNKIIEYKRRSVYMDNGEYIKINNKYDSALWFVFYNEWSRKLDSYSIKKKVE